MPARPRGSSAASRRRVVLSAVPPRRRAIVRKGKTALATVESLEDFVALTGELSLYIGRADYWVDLLIPWAKFREVYEELAR